MISFIIFNGEGVTQIVENIGGLIGIGNIPMFSLESIYYAKSYAVIIIVGCIGATPILRNWINHEKLRKLQNVLEPIFLCVILILCTSYIIDGSFNPFLYFRF